MNREIEVATTSRTVVASINIVETTHRRETLASRMEHLQSGSEVRVRWGHERLWLHWLKSD